MSDKRFLGIDVGDSYSRIALVDEDGEPEVFRSADHGFGVRSVLYFDKPGSVLVGRAAQSQAQGHPARSVRMIKRHLADASYTFTTDGVVYKAEELLSLILRKLVSHTEMQLDDSCVASAVITCRSCFGIRERHALSVAAQLAGIEVHQIVNETTAAAVFYATKQRHDHVVLIYDLGCSSFDVSLIKVKNGKVSVIYSAGDLALGGSDWDEVLVGYFANKLMVEQPDAGDPRNDLVLLQTMLLEAEEIKNKLSTRSEVLARIGFGGRRISLAVARNTFESLTESLLQRTIALTHSVVLQGEARANQPIAKVLLIGGASRMPQIAERLRSEFGLPVESLEPDLAVVKGAALIATIMPTNSHRGQIGSLFMASNAYPLGAQVEHQKFGLGTVLEHSDERIVIKFDEHGEKKFVPKMVMGSLKRSDRQPPAEKKSSRRKKIVPSQSIAKEPIATEATIEPPILPVNDVRFTAIAPYTASPGQAYLIEFWAHLDELSHEVIERSRAARGESSIRLSSRGPLRVSYGSVMRVRLSLPTLSYSGLDESIVWMGKIGNASFPVTIPSNQAEGNHIGAFSVYIGGILLARLYFDLLVAAVPGASTDPVRRRTRETRFRSAFASYANQDVNEVLARIQGMLKIVPDLDIFMDVVSLRSGDKWGQRLQEEICSRDVFYLFWSLEASRSHWVDKEWRLALATRGLDHIEPVPLQSPRIAPPPAELATLHFGDWTLAVAEGLRVRSRDETQPQ